MLHIVGGTDPEDSADGFIETYECHSCEKRGKMQYRSETNSQTFVGVCADYSTGL